MTAKNQELQASAKHELSSMTEQTRPGPIFTPAVDIFETDQAITVLADMPGVELQDVKIDLRESVLTLTAAAQRPEAADEREVLREYETGMFFRQFTLSDVIDQDNIKATLASGVLRLELPKAAAARPRQIAVRAG